MDRKLEILSVTAIRALGTVKRGWNSLLYGEENSANFRGRLPESVVYCLRYGDGLLGREQIAALADAGCLNPALYLTLKGLDGLVPEQVSVLSRLAAARECNPLTIRDAITEGITYIPEGVLVNGNKMTVRDPMTTEAVVEKLSACGKRVIDEGKSPVLVAYSATLALDPLIQACRDAGSVLYIGINPSPEGISNDVVGYEINPQQGVRSLRRGDPRPQNVVFFDDVYHTGNGIKRTAINWSGTDQLTKPIEYVCAISAKNPIMSDLLREVVYEL